MKNLVVSAISFALVLFSVAGASAQDKVQTLRTEKDGTEVVNTSEIGKSFDGFAGTVPVEIYLKDGKITQIVPLDNEETPDFFKKACTLLSKWTGKSVKEALGTRVDAVSGATFSSEALILNVKSGLEYYLKKK
jgi:uncharacterized protein with FMN-binding domain